MKHVVEWTLAALGAAVCAGGALVYWQAQASSAGSSLWPMPALALLEWAALGLVGLAAVARDGDARTRRWGLVTWIVSGALTALMFVGAWTIGPLVFVAAAAFAGAALLANQRRGRGVLPDLGAFTFGAIGNLGVLFFFIALRPA